MLQRRRFVQCGRADGRSPPPEAPPPAEPPPPPANPPAIPPPSGGVTLDPGFNESTNLIEVFYDNAKSQTENGAALAAVIRNPSPGDLVRVHGGTYVLGSRLGINAPGTKANPITIEAADGETVVLRRNDVSQNVVNVDSGSWLTLRGFEITGGSQGARLYDVHHVYFVRNHVHGTDGTAISANTHDTNHLYFVDNDVHDTAQEGEGFYLGANNAAAITHDTYVVGNYVHDTLGAVQGDGIELKTGSYACVIAQNVIERVNYPGILVYGNGDRPERNVIERNIIVASNEAGIQAAASAIVRNNLILDCWAGIQSQPHQGVNPSDLTIVHNTIAGDGFGIYTNSWNTGTNIVAANNAIYSGDGTYWHGNFGGTGTTRVGNVELTSLAAFVDLAVDGSARDATPASGSALIGAGNADHEPQDDLEGNPRTGSVDTGAVDPD